MKAQDIIKAPIFFKKNRVFRNYVGGASFARLCNDSSQDGSFPEEWLASKVKAINPVYFGARDGVSVVENTDIYFDDLLEKFPDGLLGGRKYDCLVKYLDSAIRLPVQVHPTKEFSRKNFDSDYGKTEAWLVLATRKDAKLFFGFKDKIDLETLKIYADRSLNERDILTDIITPVEARIGDVYLINAGLIHAIGAGCTILEVQEPTDFTIQIENWCGESRVSEQEKYLGLEPDAALSCFDFEKYGEAAVSRARIYPKTLWEKDGVTKQSLISYDDTPCFAENRYTVRGGGVVVPSFGPSVWAVVSGEALLKGENYARRLAQGDYFFLPYAAQNKFGISGDAVLIECLPSRQE
jgi:mannose-6-phosphate isomerase